MGDLGVDISNYSGPIRSDQVNCWQRRGVRFCVVGTQNEEICRQQLRTCAAEGLETQAYTYFYFHADPTAQVREGLGRIDGFQITAYWLDFEAAVPAGWDGELVTEWLQRAVDAALTWSPYTVGVYTGYWWWPVTGHTRAFVDLPLWVALYDNLPNLQGCHELVPGWAPVMKQHRGTHELCGVTVDADYRENSMTPAQKKKLAELEFQMTCIRLIQERKYQDLANALSVCRKVRAVV